ncbi:hypothetical protein DXU06_08055 [Bradyrhizobium elkanii]|nr:hypothetical protein A6X20_34075 [Bradyrhizobium elkanii]QOZ18224.1 hypothetical protein XI02_26725 [Bradyrhizobium sp. CCBAU 21365]BBB99315.1 hypothetical protein BE61_47600 [Bradyrhizobium elkanii USDA 61]GEC57740.1 hypothetical protein BEL01nite_67830 [Bradyrhizobium elkanii]
MIVARLSLSDKLTIAELETGREHLLLEPASQRLLMSLRRRLQSITQNIYIVRHISEQAEDLFDVLVDGKLVVHIELPRDARSEEVVFKIFGVDEYLNTRTHLTKIGRRRLKLALELAEQHARRTDKT